MSLDHKSTSGSPLASAQRIVIKIGSALIADAQRGCIRSGWLSGLIDQICEEREKEWLIVSSGAVALGRPALRVNKNKLTSSLPLEQKQAAASIGQVLLAQQYAREFSQRGLQCGQILLSTRDTEERRSSINARATIETLLRHKIIPVINENDTVATQEIRFGDNDRLAARVAQLAGADLLILLSTIDGLYTKNPARHNDALHLHKVDKIDKQIMELADKSLSEISTGGMITKLDAAKIATEAGCSVIIADGRDKMALAFSHKYTFFPASCSPPSAHKKWIRAHLKPKGTLIIDSGAVTALREGSSLLPIGVKEIAGSFSRGDAVNVKDSSNHLIARGLIAYDRALAEKIMGHHSDRIADITGFLGRTEMIHRDDLALE